MSGLSISHLAIMMVVIVLIFGTSKLKNLGKDLGGAIKGFKESMKEGESTATVNVATPPHIAQHSPINGTAIPIDMTQKEIR